jgi:hypothetical protein
MQKNTIAATPESLAARFIDVLSDRVLGGFE